MPITALLGLDDEPAELAGYGPIPAAMAREIAAEGAWRRLLTDPASGALLDYGTTIYRPPASLAGHVRARDKVCTFPGCRRRDAKCDLDHRVPFPRGHTSADNLHLLCRRHHRCKKHKGWAVTRDETGATVWTTPTGRTYTSPPEPIAEPTPPPPADPQHDPPPF